MRETARLASAVVALVLSAPACADNFRSDSSRFGNPKMDIVITETERTPRTSALNIQVRAIGSSVGSSFFILCSVRELARQRGNFRYVVKLEEQSPRKQMLIGFLKEADESPERIDARFAGQKALDLEQFAPICAQMG